MHRLCPVLVTRWGPGLCPLEWTRGSCLASRPPVTMASRQSCPGSGVLGAAPPPPGGRAGVPSLTLSSDGPSYRFHYLLEFLPKTEPSHVVQPWPEVGRCDLRSQFCHYWLCDLKQAPPPLWACCLTWMLSKEPSHSMSEWVPVSTAFLGHSSAVPLPPFGRSHSKEPRSARSIMSPAARSWGGDVGQTQAEALTLRWALAGGM